MSKINNLIFKGGANSGSSIPAHNTIIGGVGASTIPDKATLSSTIGVAEGSISTFDIVDNDVYCTIDINYTMPTDAFNNNSEITFYNDIESKVTSFGGRSFRTCTNLIEVTFPGVTSTGGETFGYCNLLETFNGDNLTNINNYAFVSCSSLVNINTSKITNIGTGGFQNCNSLITLDLSELLTISGDSFNSCSSLTTINAPKLTNLSSRVFRLCSNLTTLTCPNVTTISFEIVNGAGVQNLDLPLVTNIPANAFVNSKLITLDIIGATTITGTASFSNSTQLVTLNAPNISGSLPNSTFQSCSKLQTTGMDYTQITSLGSAVFNGCAELIDVLDFQNVTSDLQVNTFQNCNKVPKIFLPKVKSIVGNSVFNYCNLLNEIDLTGIETVTSAAVQFLNCSSLTSLSMPLLENAKTATLQYLSGCDDLFLPSLKTLGDDELYNNSLYQLKSGCTITVNVFMQTSNAGGVEGDLQDAIDNKSATIIYADVPLDDIISRYTFEDSVEDVKGTNDGIPSDLIYNDDLCTSKAGIFNGSSDSNFIIPNDSSLIFTDGSNDKPFSISFTIKFEDYTNTPFKNPRLIDKISDVDNNNREYRIIVVNGTIRFTLFDNTSSNSISTYVDEILDLKRSYHITATYDGSGTSSGMRVYINGLTLPQIKGDVGTYSSMKITNNDITVGRDGITTNSLNNFNGKMDELIFWNKELSRAEVALLSAEQFSRCTDIEPPIAEEIPLQNIISRYKFEDNVKDFVGLNDGVATDLVYSDSGCIGKQGDFNGTSSFVEIPSDSSLSFTNGSNDLPFSISFLVKFDSISSTFAFVNKRDAISQDEYTIYYGYGIQALQFLIFSNGNSVDRIGIISDFNFELNETYHITFTYDASGLESGMNIYLNGVLLDNTSNSQGTYVKMSNYPVPVHVNNRTWDSNKGDYKMDELIFWDKELSAAEVLKLATDQLACIDIDPDLIPLTSMISRWPLDTDLVDTVGSNDGTADGTVIHTPAGQVNGAVDFSTSGKGAMIVADADNLSFTDGSSDLPFSVSFMFKLDTYDSADGHWFLNKRDTVDGSPPNEWQIFHFQGAVHVTLYDGADNSIFIRVIAAMTPILDQWYHVVATYDGSESSDGLEIYIDGVKQNLTIADSGIYVGQTNTTAPLHIGKRAWLGANATGQVDGEMDDIIIWDRELSPASVRELYEQQMVNGADIEGLLPLENIVSRWRFDDNALDSVGDNDGTENNVSYVTGLVGKAVDFNGVSNKVILDPNPSFVIGTSPFSFSTLIWFDALQDSWFFNKLTLFDEDREYFFLYQNSTKTFRSIIYDKVNSDNISSVYDFEPTVGVWYHFVVTWNGQNTSGSMRTYINAVGGGASEEKTDFTSVVGGSSQATIGQSQHSSSSVLNGRLDDSILWNKELTPVEVTQLYTNQIAGVDIDPNRIPLTEYTMSAIGFVITSVCQQGSAVPHYHNGVNALPEAGDTVYTDSAGTSPVNGGLQYWKIQGAYMQIDAAGVVTLVEDCGQAFGMSSSGNGTISGACALSPSITFWHNGALTNPGLGDTVYTDEELTVPKVGGNLWYHVATGALVRLDNNGLVTEVDVCP